MANCQHSSVSVFMEVIGTDILHSFALVHNQSRKTLDSWLKTARQNNWQSLQDIKKIYCSVDGGVKGQYTVFNIAGNKYRLITIINYAREIVAIEAVFTHAQYDRWNKK